MYLTLTCQDHLHNVSRVTGDVVMELFAVEISAAPAGQLAPQAEVILADSNPGSHTESTNSIQPVARVVKPSAVLPVALKDRSVPEALALHLHPMPLRLLHPRLRRHLLQVAISQLLALAQGLQQRSLIQLRSYRVVLLRLSS